MAKPPLRVGVSACLIGRKVRFDGQHKRDDWLVDVLGPFVEWVPVCPELEVGMGVPRETIRLVGPSEGPRLVAERSGLDHTDAMRRYAEEKVRELAGLELCGFVLKKDSPSCGMARVRVYGERKGPPRRDGVGAFARVLLDRLPALPVEEEGRLHDAALRESFVERLFASARFRAAVAAGMGRGELVAFHARHKLALLAHSPDGYRKLGRLVAAQGRGSNAAAVEAYGRGLMAALAVPSRRGRHANVLQHMLGYFRGLLDETDRRELEQVVKDYQRGHVPLVVPQTLFRHHARRHADAHGIGWLAAQTYLDPDPKELLLRNHV